MHELLDQIAPAAVVGACSFIAWFLKKLGTTVAELNTRMAVYLERITTVAEHIEDHEDRIRQLENGPLN